MDFDRARRIMVDSQIRTDEVTAPAIVSAFLNTPRDRFTPKSKRAVAYAELEIETSQGRALWIPRDTAKLIAAADPRPGDIALVVGAGAGYEAALLARLVETVIALDEAPAVVEAMGERFAELDIDGAVAVEGPLAEGLADQAPFDVIYVCGMVQDIAPAWTAQLSDGGRLAVVVEMDKDLGRGRIYSRSGDAVSHVDHFDARPPKFDAFDRKPSFQF